MISAFHLLASFVVASIAFLYPLNALSLMLAFASLVLSFVDKGDQDMDKKINTKLTMILAGVAVAIVLSVVGIII